MSRAAELEALAHSVAEKHLIACQDAMYPDGEDALPESPAFAPFCGCETCIAREVLMAAWPHLLELARLEVRDEAR